MFISSRLRRLALIGVASFVALAFITAACGGDDDDDQPTAAANTPAASGSPTTAPANTPAAGETSAPETPAAGGATIAVAEVGLVDGRGITLYVFANDTADSGTSACNGACATTWPPLTVTGDPTAGDGATGETGTITREDGTTQVTYNGMPLYFFATDEAPGDTNGASIPNWSIAQP